VAPRQHVWTLPVVRSGIVAATTGIGIVGVLVYPAAAQDGHAVAEPGSSPPGCMAPWQDGQTAMSPGSPADSDCDGLSDADENYWRLDPYNRDSDGDGLADGDEFHDRYARSDPSRWDSDYDGLGDGHEVFNLGTDPWNWDTDGDGRGDGEEVSTGSNPRGWG
jgi:hypothetical protein